MPNVVNAAAAAGARELTSIPAYGYGYHGFYGFYRWYSWYQDYYSYYWSYDYYPSYSYNAYSNPADEGGCVECSYIYPPGFDNTTARIRLAQRQGEPMVSEDGYVRGVVQVNEGSGWGTVCGKYAYGNVEAVACEELGFDYGSETHKHLFNFTSVHIGTPIHYTYTYCYGWETSLTSCSADYYSWYSCTHHDDLALQCGHVSEYYNPDIEKPTIRLLQTPDTIEDYGEGAGLVQVFLDNQWGTVCGDNWNSLATVVACRELGFYYGDEEGRWGIDMYSVATDNSIMMDEVVCDGSEDSLVECSFNSFNDCSYYDDVAVRCRPEPTGTFTYPPGELNPRVRIYTLTEDDDTSDDIMPFESPVVESRPEEVTGIVHVKVMGQWGTICNDHFTHIDATVICNELGYLHGQETPISELDVSADIISIIHGTPILMDDVSCTGTESSILECTALLGKDNNNCVHGEDVAISCGNWTNEGYSGEIHGECCCKYYYNWQSSSAITYDCQDGVQFSGSECGVSSWSRYSTDVCYTKEQCEAGGPYTYYQYDDTTGNGYRCTWTADGTTTTTDLVPPMLTTETTTFRQDNGVSVGRPGDETATDSGVLTAAIAIAAIAVVIAIAAVLAVIFIVLRRRDRQQVAGARLHPRRPQTPSISDPPVREEHVQIEAARRQPVPSGDSAEPADSDAPQGGKDRDVWVAPAKHSKE